MVIFAPVTHAKITNVEALFNKHFGDKWQEREDLKFNLNIIRGGVSQEEEDHEDSFCERREEETPDLRI